MSSIAHSQSTSTGWAERPGSSRFRTILIVGIFAVLFAALGYGLYELTAPRQLNMADPQSWLPKQQLDHPVDRTLVGTYADPALTVEGDFVEVRTATFSALAVMNGPVVPGEGLPHQASFTTCTWTISLSHVVGRVPISVADFDSIDHSQTVFKPYLVPGERTPPTVVTTGHDLTFQIRSVMPVGEGLLRWAPDGDHIVAKWDYQVEND
ncbi:MAG: hypothetical protein ACLQRH_14585 [Acidimicrobiales bacterium]